MFTLHEFMLSIYYHDECVRDTNFHTYDSTVSYDLSGIAGLYYNILS